VVYYGARFLPTNHPGVLQLSLSRMQFCAYKSAMEVDGGGYEYDNADDYGDDYARGYGDDYGDDDGGGEDEDDDGGGEDGGSEDEDDDDDDEDDGDDDIVNQDLAEEAWDDDIVDVEGDRGPFPWEPLREDLLRLKEDLVAADPTMSERVILLVTSETADAVFWALQGNPDISEQELELVAIELVLRRPPDLLRKMQDLLASGRLDVAFHNNLLLWSTWRLAQGSAGGSPALLELSADLYRMILRTYTDQNKLHAPGFADAVDEIARFSRLSRLLFPVMDLAPPQSVLDNRNMLDRLDVIMLLLEPGRLNPAERLLLFQRAAGLRFEFHQCTANMECIATALADELTPDTWQRALCYAARGGDVGSGVLPWVLDKQPEPVPNAVIRQAFIALMHGHNPNIPHALLLASQPGFKLGTF
jgi:hypothetical protein